MIAALIVFGRSGGLHKVAISNPQRSERNRLPIARRWLEQFSWASVWACCWVRADGDEDDSETAGAKPRSANYGYRLFSTRCYQRNVLTTRQCYSKKHTAHCTLV